jgi:hypothetical protein
VISAASAPLATAAITAINKDDDFDRLFISLLFPRRRRCSPSFMLIILLITLLCNSLNLFFQSHIKYIDDTERAPTYY